MCTHAQRVREAKRRKDSSSTRILCATIISSTFKEVNLSLLNSFYSKFLMHMGSYKSHTLI